MSLNPENLVGTLRDKIRRSLKDPDTKLLEKYEVVFPDTNQLSKEGRAMVLQFIFENDPAVREYILAQLRALEDESEKAAKKAAKASK